MARTTSVFYPISPGTQQQCGTRWRYLVRQPEGGGSPSDLLLTDRSMVVCVVLWVLAVALIIYRPI
jgi:hypothetical protein